MTFVDTSVFVYAVGRDHPRREPAQAFFVEARRDQVPLYTSAEVLQELLHVYLRPKRYRELDEAMTLVSRAMKEVWALEPADVELARQLERLHPTLAARDLCHLASCRRRGVHEIETFDEALATAAANSGTPP
ncbi:MAG: type II toxin-antitoxin system VapC family toxin [Chloroflexi bacterium]|nr:type II toxin-antitoxin system VapC family toxin [Chloroflexota bacterium]